MIRITITNLVNATSSFLFSFPKLQESPLQPAFIPLFSDILACLPSSKISNRLYLSSTGAMNPKENFLLSPTKGANGEPLLTFRINQALAQAQLPLPKNDTHNMDSAPPRITHNPLSPTEAPSPQSSSPKVQRRIALLRELRAPPFKYAWGFYHDKHSDSSNYEGRLTLMKDNIITVKPFWEVLNSFPLDRLQLKDSVHFFKRGVKPVWEDPRNVKGGAWTFRVPKAQADQFWKEILMMAVGEQFADVIQPGAPTPSSPPPSRPLTNPTPPGDDLCGLSLSVRFNNNLISIWNRNGANEKTKDGILAVILDQISTDLKPREGHYYYKRHSEHAGFSEMVAKANEKKADEGRIREAEVMSVEGDRALLSDEGVSVEELEKGAG